MRHLSLFLSSSSDFKLKKCLKKLDSMNNVENVEFHSDNNCSLINHTVHCTAGGWVPVDWKICPLFGGGTLADIIWGRIR
jgi:hypothetical protein